VSNLHDQWHREHVQQRAREFLALVAAGVARVEAVSPLTYDLGRGDLTPARWTTRDGIEYACRCAPFRGGD